MKSGTSASILVELTNFPLVWMLSQLPGWLNLWSSHVTWFSLALNPVPSMTTFCPGHPLEGVTFVIELASAGCAPQSSASSPAMLARKPERGLSRRLSALAAALVPGVASLHWYILISLDGFRVSR